MWMWESLDYPTFTGTAGKDFIKPLNQKLGRVLWRINVIGKESTEVGVPKLLAHWLDKIRTCVSGNPFELIPESVED